MPVKKKASTKKTVTPKKPSRITVKTEIVEELGPDTDVEEVTTDETPEESETVEEETKKEETPEEENEEYVEATKDVEKTESLDTSTGAVESTEEPMDSENGTFTKETLGGATNDNGSRSIMTFIVVVILTILVAGGGLFFFGDKLKGLMSKVEAPAAEPTEEPTPTAEEVNVSQNTIEVLNASGTSGAAAKAKAFLTEAGFNVDSVGNADENDLVKTTISAKEDVSKAFLDKLKETLSSEYDLQDEVDELEDSEDADVQVFIGSGTP